MDAGRVVAILLIVGGALSLACGGFSYARETHTADIGTLRLEMLEKRQVNIPIWAGIGAIVGGVLLLAVPRKA